VRRERIAVQASDVLQLLELDARTDAQAPKLRRMPVATYLLPRVMPPKAAVRP